MRYQLKEYHRPTDWQEAQQLLARQELRTAPLFLSPHAQAPEDWPYEAVVDLSALDAAGIQEKAGTLLIGLATSLQRLVDSPVLQTRYQGLLSQCAEFSGTLGLRNYANLGGLLLDPAAPGEMAAALLCLDAAVMVRRLDGTLKPYPLADFMRPDWMLAPGELAVSLSIPAGVGGSVDLERVSRTTRDKATVAAVVRLEVKAGTAVTVRAAAFGASPVTQRILPVENLLSGKVITPILLDEACSTAQEWAMPTSDIRGSATYRKAMAGVLVRRALQSALQIHL